MHAAKEPGISCFRPEHSAFFASSEHSCTLLRNNNAGLSNRRALCRNTFCHPTRMGLNVNDLISIGLQ